jgi:CBS-domain-containing membrane protein
MTDSTAEPVHALTAGDLMHKVLAVVPRQMLMRQAVRLIQQVGAGEAPVVDEHGRYVGMLSPADAFRWVAAGCPETVVGPVFTCPYQVRARLLNGDEAVICILGAVSCPFQAVQPTTAGRHSEICMRQGTEPSPFGTWSSYVTTNVVTVRHALLLPDLVRQLIDARADRVVVLDECDRLIGIVSATEVLSVVAKALTNESCHPHSMQPSRRN